MQVESYKRPIVLKLDKCLGYLYFMDKDHPLASKAGRVYHHRHVASIKEGRWISLSDVVHHLDSDRANNRPENIVVISRSVHAVIHRDSAPRLKKRCAFCGEQFITKIEKMKYCSQKCSQKSRRSALFQVSFDELKKMMSLYSAEKIGKKFGISGTAVRKRCRNIGIMK